jgi:hypothetical protein
MKTFRIKPLIRGLVLVLILAVLNFFQGCAAYRISKKNPKNEERLSRYQDKGRYFILKNKGKTYHLSDLRIINSTLTGIISEVPEEHLKNVYPAGEQPKVLNQGRSELIDSEVILYTHLEIPENDTTVTIPLNSIDEVVFYKWKMPTGAIIAVVVVCGLGGGFLLLLLVAAIMFAINGVM